MMLTVKIFIVIAMLVLSVIFIMVILRRDSNGIAVAIAPIMFLIVLAAIFLAVSPFLKEKMLQAEEKNAIKNGYTVYLDGEEVDSDKVDLSLYSVKYDDDKQIAYATRKVDDGSDGLIGGIIGYFIGRGLQ